MLVVDSELGRPGDALTIFVSGNVTFVRSTIFGKAEGNFGYSANSTLLGGSRFGTMVAYRSTIKNDQSVDAVLASSIYEFETVSGNCFGTN